MFGLTAIGRAGERGPAAQRRQATGDAPVAGRNARRFRGGPRAARADREATGPLVDVYRRPVPQLAAGQALAPHAHAMMDVSDGLLLDALRLARGERLQRPRSTSIAVPLSEAFVAERGDDLDARLFAATGGDDYALLAALPAGLRPLNDFLYLPGRPSPASGLLPPASRLSARSSGGPAVALPESLGHEHRSNSASPVADRALAACCRGMRRRPASLTIKPHAVASRARAP